VPPSSGEYSVDINPATEEPLALVAQGSAADVDVAVRAARAALNVWNALRAAERGRILIRFAELLRTHQDELATLESLDAGKPIAAVQRQDIPAAIDTLAYYAGWCVHDPRTGRRGGGDCAVEFPADDRHVENRACASVRLHDDRQAR
jgi:acyl-CoA reductase-like NAD-dependent aldehyde dehydrogenase